MQIILSPGAVNKLKRLPKPETKKNLRKLHLFETDPLAGKPLEGKLKGIYSLRSWPYRILYRFLKDRHIIRIDVIDHRQGVYNKY